MILNSLPEDKGLIVFDGYCVLCNSLVSFLLRIDRKKRFIFTTFNSHSWKILSGRVSSGSDSIVLFLNSEHYIQSNAVIMIIRELGYPWRLLNIIRVIPLNWREKIYRFTAKHRYKVFGRNELCSIPNPEVRNRFLE